MCWTKRTAASVCSYPVTDNHNILISRNFPQLQANPLTSEPSVPPTTLSLAAILPCRPCPFLPTYSSQHRHLLQPRHPPSASPFTPYLLSFCCGFVVGQLGWRSTSWWSLVSHKCKDDKLTNSVKQEIQKRVCIAATTWGPFGAAITVWGEERGGRGIRGTKQQKHNSYWFPLSVFIELNRIGSKAYLSQTPRKGYEFSDRPSMEDQSKSGCVVPHQSREGVATPTTHTHTQPHPSHAG
jgi:hypothetical protein